MKFTQNLPHEDPELSRRLLADNWKRIKEPRRLATTILASIPFTLINGAASVGVMLPFYNPFTALAGEQPFSFTLAIDFRILFYIAGFFVFALLHEMIHAVLIPGFIKSEKTFWGITPFGGFVATTEEISRMRFLLISIAPFGVLSILLPVILGAAGLLTPYLALIILVNAMGSGVDVLSMLLILFQTPPGSRIVANGFETYFR
jgi:hypothetical protein